MNSQGPQGQHSGHAASRDDQRSHRIESKFKLGPLIGLVDALPFSLNSLLGEVFSGRAKLGGDPLTPCQFDYFLVIDDRPVKEVEHIEVCTASLNQLRAIVAWCNSNSVSLSAMIDKELSQGDLLRSQSGKEWLKERSPVFLLKIMHDLDSGKLFDSVLEDIKKYWVHGDIRATVRKLVPHIISEIERKQTGPAGDTNPNGKSYPELGVRYYPFGNAAYLYREPKVPHTKAYVELTEKQMNMFEKLLYAADHQCGDEQLNGPSGKKDERERNRKLRDALNNKLHEVGLEIRDCRLVRI